MEIKKYINDDKILENYDNKGYVLIKHFFTKKFSKKIKKNLNIFLNKNKKILKNVNFADKKTKKINTVHNIKSWKFLNKIHNHSKVNFFAKKLLGCKIKKFGAEVFAKPSKIGLASPPHQDNFYWNIKSNKGLTFWIALDKTDKKNGSIYYYEKSHKLVMLNHEPSFDAGSSQRVLITKKIKKNKKVYPKLNIGDILIHNCLIVHGSKKNLSNQNRMGLTLRFIPSGSQFNQKNKKKYERSLKLQKFFF